MSEVFGISKQKRLKKHWISMIENTHVQNVDANMKIGKTKQLSRQMWKWTNESLEEIIWMSKDIRQIRKGNKNICNAENRTYN